MNHSYKNELNKYCQSIYTINTNQFDQIIYTDTLKPVTHGYLPYRLFLVWNRQFQNFIAVYA